eukprot:TRINITY_DN5610_c0_g1_i1.p1 TRINITY_DN5610_c0_g1~~TRINITY_DN5610_c0_g1_i1.p1  ORF type:complete len:190 (+),score=53.41 TRINITY_DN5610_c0_g1_i1:15-584(+)
MNVSVDNFRELFPELSLEVIQNQIRLNKNDFENTFSSLSRLNQKLIESKELNLIQENIAKQEVKGDLFKINDTSIRKMEERIRELELKVAEFEGEVQEKDREIEELRRQLVMERARNEKESLSVRAVSDLVESVRFNVDKSLEQSSYGNKLVMEVKKQLALSFLNEYKEAKGKIDGSITMSASSFSSNK